MEKNNEIKFKHTYTEIFQSMSWLILSIAPLGLLYVTKVPLGLLHIIAILPTSVIAYIGIAKALYKRLIKIGDDLFLYNGPFKYKLRIDTLRVCYEKVWILGGNYKDYFGLALYRDINKIFGFSINNKFILVYEMDEIKLKYYQQEFKDKLGLEIYVVESII